MWWKRKKKIEPIPEFDLSNFKMPIVKNYSGVPLEDMFNGPSMTAPVPDEISFKVVHRNWDLDTVFIDHGEGEGKRAMMGARQISDRFLLLPWRFQVSIFKRLDCPIDPSLNDEDLFLGMFKWATEHSRIDALLAEIERAEEEV